MADLTTTQIDTLITNAYNALNTALADPKPNYRIGNRQVAFADYIKMLREQLSGLREMKAGIPSESVADLDYDVTELGDDDTEYEGDSST